MAYSAFCRTGQITAAPLFRPVPQMLQHIDGKATAFRQSLDKHHHFHLNPLTQHGHEITIDQYDHAMGDLADAGGVHTDQENKRPRFACDVGKSGNKLSSWGNRVVCKPVNARMDAAVGAGSDVAQRVQVRSNPPSASIVVPVLARKTGGAAD